MASQDFTISGYRYSDPGNTRILLHTFNPRLQVNSDLTPLNSIRYLNSIRIIISTVSGGNLRASLQLTFADTLTGSAREVNEDLSDRYENSGYVYLSQGDNEVQIPIGGLDYSDPYNYSITHQPTATAINNFLRAIPASRPDLTLTLLDEKPAARINPVFPIAAATSSFKPNFLDVDAFSDVQMQIDIETSFSPDIEQFNLTYTAIEPTFPAAEASSSFEIGFLHFNLIISNVFPEATATGEFDVDIDTFGLSAAGIMLGWVAEIEGIIDKPHRVWSGYGDLQFEGEIWTGTQSQQGPFVAISPLTNNVGEPARRASVSIAVPKSTIRQMLAVDVGPVEVSIKPIQSQNNGKSWIRLARGFKGFLSRPNFDSNTSIYTVELETWSGDSDRGSPRYWSDEHQRQEHPGDKGFEFARALAEGEEISWPP